MESFVKARAGQVEQIFAMFQAVIAHLRAQGIEQWDEIYPALHDIKQDVAHGAMYVFLDDGKVQSAVTLNEEQDPTYVEGDWEFKENPIAVIHRLCVHPNAQGKGFGKRTVLMAEEHLRKLGYRSIRLDAFEQNYTSNAMYRSLGYQTAGEVQLRKGLFYLYEKRLTL